MATSANPNHLAPPDLAAYQGFSEDIVSAIDKYLENKRSTNKLVECTSPVSKSGSNSQSKSAQQKQIDEKMNLIMNMVQANS